MNYVASVSSFPDGRLAELFITNHKVGSDADAAARDSAVVCSIALQFGVPVDVIRKALLRDLRGNASSPLGVALDLLAGDFSMTVTRINVTFTERQLELFGARCKQLVDRVCAGQIPFIEAIDMAYSAATWSGVVDSAGDDAVQWVMATVFINPPRSTKQTGGEQ